MNIAQALVQLRAAAPISARTTAGEGGIAGSSIKRQNKDASHNQTKIIMRTLHAKDNPIPVVR